MDIHQTKQFQDIVSMLMAYIEKGSYEEASTKLAEYLDNPTLTGHLLAGLKARFLQKNHSEKDIDLLLEELYQSASSWSTLGLF